MKTNYMKTIILLSVILLCILLNYSYKETLQNNYKILKVTEWYGRLGNNLITLYDSLYFAIQNNYDAIIFPKHEMFNTQIIKLNHNIDLNDNNMNDYNDICIIKRGEEMFNYFKQIENKCFDVNKNIIIGYLKKIFKIKYKSIKKGSEKDLYIHIRSGDLIDSNGNSTGFSITLPEYRPLPLSFYTTIIDNNKYDNVYIISEDDKFPAISILLDKYPNVKFKIRSLDDDIKLIMGARNIAYGWGSFIPTLLWFNEGLNNVYISQYYDNIFGINYDKECWCKYHGYKNKKIIPIKQEYINIIKKNTGKPILKYYIINN